MQTIWTTLIESPKAAIECRTDGKPSAIFSCDATNRETTIESHKVAALAYARSFGWGDRFVGGCSRTDCVFLSSDNMGERIDQSK